MTDLALYVCLSPRSSLLERAPLCFREGSFSGILRAQARHLKPEFVQWSALWLMGFLGSGGLAPLEMCAPSWLVSIFVEDS